jgi:hypothetical protein
MSAAKNQHDEYLRQFKSHHKEAFQSWFGKLARAMHGDGNFQEIRNTRGDGALDGFVINSQLVYQVYAPARMDEVRDSVTADKIRNNFQTAYSTLSGQLKEWVFLHNHPEPKLGQLSASAINELKTQHPAIGIEVLDIASLWERLKELPSNKLESLFGKALSADSLQFNVFYPLDTLLERVSSSIAFPSRALFEKNLAFFLREEVELMDEIETALESGSGERLALLMGNTATGKTVMACNIGRKFQSAGCHVFYARLDSTIRFAEVWIDLLAASAIGEVLFIIEDCHLNSDVASSIYRRFASLPKNVGCLLVGRPVDEESRRSQDQFAGDYVQELSERDRCFSLDETLSGRFGDKVLGIARKHKVAWEVANGATLSVGEESKLVENVQGNLFYLQAALSFWTPQQALAELNHPAILERIAARYLNPLNESERKLLLQIAALGEMEIKFQIPPGCEQFCEKLRHEGICGLERPSGLIALPHSGFASLLVEAYEKSRVFVSHFANRADFQLAAFRGYLRAFERFPVNLEEVFVNLFEHRIRKVFVPLLKDADVQKRICEYYRQQGTIEGLVNFLFKAKIYLTPAEVSHYAQSLTIENPELRQKILASQKPVLNYVKLLKTIHRGHREDYARLAESFSDRDRAAMLQESDFYIICYGIRSLHEADPRAARFLAEQADARDLASKARKEMLEDVLRGLRHLRAVAGRKAADVFRLFVRSDAGGFVEQLQFGGMRFDEMADAFTELNLLDSAAARALFDHIPKPFWVSAMRSCNITALMLGLSRMKDINARGAQALLEMLDTSVLKSLTRSSRLSLLGNGLAEINKISPRTARRLVEAVETDRLAQLINRADLVHVGKGLSEIARVSVGKARAGLAAADQKLLAKKVTTAPLKTLTKALNELHVIDYQITRGLYTSLDEGLLGAALNMAAMEAFGRAVRELHTIDPKKTARVLDRISLQALANRLQSVSLLQISHTLAELNQADPDRARALYYKMPSELLAKKLASEQLDFQQLGSLTCNLTKVDGADRKTSAMLRGTGTDFLIRGIHAERFEGIAAGLYDIFKCDAALGREIMSQLDVRFLEAKAKQEQFEKICQAMNRLATIDRRKTEELLKRFNPAWLSERCAALAADRLGGCLSELAEVNADFAKTVLHAHGTRRVSESLRRLVGPRRAQALMTIRKIDPGFLR